MYRTQILLEPGQHRALAEIARREGRSISDVVRQIIRRQLDQQEQARRFDAERQLEALERIRKHRDAILERRGGKPLEIDIVELIRQAREERDERNLGGQLGRR